MEESAVIASTAPEIVKDISQEKTRIEVEESQKSPNESEYDSAGSYSDDEGEKERARNSREQTESENEGSVGLERESGDGQESVPARKVDDDEDKKNPQYIPKRGTFYEHDDRTIDDDPDANAAELEKEKELKKKVWQDKKERWSHDRFNDSEQAPKSRAELVAIYGYDIRNEDGPPRARRRRRYGRGPNKYTRNWEDEDAYNKPPPPRIKKPQKKLTRSEEFPPLNSSNRNDINREKIKDDNKSSERPEQNSPETNGNSKNIPQPSHESSQFSPPPLQEPNRNQRVGSGRVVKPKREIKDSDYKGFTTKTRQVRNIKTDQKILPKSQKKDDIIHTQNFTNRNSSVQEIEKEMSKLNVQESKGGKHGNQRQGSVPPRLQSEPKGSKRYSSLRQRSLPESATPPFSQPQHSNYYPNEFSQPNQVALHQNAQIHPSTTQVPQIAPPPLPPIPQVPVTAAPILQAPPQFAPPFAQAPPFLQAAPPPFIPQQTPQIINYVPSQPQFPQGYQGYQQQFNQTQPELYPPQTGITYYSTDQQVTQRAAPLKRPKAAIPIVAPPPLDLKGKGRDDDVSSYEGDISASDGQTGDSSSAQESNTQDCGYTWNILSINSSHFKH